MEGLLSTGPTPSSLYKSESQVCRKIIVSATSRLFCSWKVTFCLISDILQSKKKIFVSENSDTKNVNFLTNGSYFCDKQIERLNKWYMKTLLFVGFSSW